MGTFANQASNISALESKFNQLLKVSAFNSNNVAVLDDDDSVSRGKIKLYCIFLCIV
jgi:hypothetical protein